MNVFHHHSQQVQIGDKCFYVVKEEDIQDEDNDISSTLVKHGKRVVVIMLMINLQDSNDVIR